MMRFIFKIIISSLAVLATAWLLPGVDLKDYLTALLVALVLSIFNAIVKPVLIFLTIPATIFTFGLFLLVINAIIILLVDYVVPGFSTDSFWWALLFSIIVSVITSILQGTDKKKRNRKR